MNVIPKININVAIISWNIFQCIDSEFHLLFSMYNPIRQSEEEKIRQFKFEYVISDTIMLEIEDQLDIKF